MQMVVFAGYSIPENERALDEMEAVLFLVFFNGGRETLTGINRCLFIKYKAEGSKGKQTHVILQLNFLCSPPPHMHRRLPAPLPDVHHGTVRQIITILSLKSFGVICCGTSIFTDRSENGRARYPQQGAEAEEEEALC